VVQEIARSGGQSYQRDQAPLQRQWQQKEILRQRARDEQKEFGRNVVERYRRMTLYDGRERERRNNILCPYQTLI
jgi:hypothetical protein